MATFIERQQQNFDGSDDNLKNQLNSSSKFERIVTDRKILTFSCFILFTLSVPLLVFLFVIQFGYEELQSSTHTCLVGNDYRITCGKNNISKDLCIQLDCCYDNKTSECYHSIPSSYKYAGCYDEDLTKCIFRPIKLVTPFNNQSLHEMRMSIIEVNASILQIILHTHEIDISGPKLPYKTYEVKRYNDTLGAEIYRNKSKLFTTFRGPLITSEGYWEWTFQLTTTQELFGLGHVLIPKNTSVTKVIYKNEKDHNTLPIFIARLNDYYHSAIVQHDGPLEVTILPSRLIVLKSIAGTKISITISLGSTPSEAIQYTRLSKPSPLPYWALGVHICRDGLQTLNEAIEEYLDFYKKEDSISYASDCIHENLYIMLNDRTKHDLFKLIEDLQRKSRFLMSLPPQIDKNNSFLFNKAVKYGVLYKNKNGSIFNGTYLHKKVVYPDFSSSSIGDWIKVLLTVLPITTGRYDGFVLKDNWPQEETYSFDNEESRFPYITEILNSSLSKTIPWNVVGANSLEEHIVKHNSYGLLQARNLRENVDLEFLLTSSFDYGSSEGALIQNIDLSWANLKEMIRTTLYHSVFGNPLISIPVCGSTIAFEDSQEAICIRWYLVAATFPIFRISSFRPRRDPRSLSTKFARNSALQALHKRHMLLPYYYTILRDGEPLTRPMFYNFYNDTNVFNLDEQYMLGDALLVAHPLLPDIVSIKVYLPMSVAVWYEFWSGMKYNETGWTDLNVVETDWIMFVAQGHIIPMKEYTNTVIGRTSTNDRFTLVVALNCTVEKQCSSKGLVKLEKSYLEFIATESDLDVTNIVQAKKDLCDSSESSHPRYIANILIYGHPKDHQRAVKADNTIEDLCKLEENRDRISIHYFNET